MRLWSIHPTYLDTKGLVAVWREGLLVLHVLSGKTKGYTKHPQLQRFQHHTTPVEAITAYLHGIVDEAEQRNFHFDRQKLSPFTSVSQIPVTRGQIEYETNHLKEKLRLRDPHRLLSFESQVLFLTHPLFELVEGPIASWERVQRKKENSPDSPPTHPSQSPLQ